MFLKMNKLINFFKIGLVIVTIYIVHALVFYFNGDFSENEISDIEKTIDVKRLPKIIYNEDMVDKLYNSISLKNQYNNSK